MIRAGIDIGTNTILLLVADITSGIKVLEDHVRVVRLGQGVDKNRAFHPDAMERARSCFQEYAQILKKYPGVEVRAVATSGSRDAKNSEEFFNEIRKLGIPIRVISGEEEALLSFKGAMPGNIDPQNMAVLDIGGGSTEVVGLKPGTQELFRYSFDMGCVRLCERFMPSDPSTPQEQAALLSFVRKELKAQESLLKGLKGKTLVGVAGTATYLASSALGLKKFDLEKVHGYQLSLKEIERLIAEFTPMKASERIGIGGMDKGRADVILAGALLLKEVLLAADLSGLQISVRGLRFGLMTI